MNQKQIWAFHKLCLSTLVAVYVLILVGGIVRSTGSGMGCPDWPKCFGNWVPPTSVDQLPENYKEVYSQYRHTKNVKFARYLAWAGMEGTAHQLLNDKSIREESDFNATKTWVEYVNRLVGVVIGLFIVAVFVRSIPFRQTHPSLFFLALLTLAAVIVQGWFGSIVVSTNLTTWTVTVHMFIALAIVALLILLYVRSSDTQEQGALSPLTQWVLLACMASLLIQVFLGTEVRAGIDRVAAWALPRNEWIENVGKPFLVHRSFSWLVVALHLIFFFLMRRNLANRMLVVVLAAFVLITFLSGTGMAYFDVPAFLQPIHLWVATVIFGIQFYLYLKMRSFVTQKPATSA